MLNLMIHMMDGDPYGSLFISGHRYDMSIIAKVLKKSVNLVTTIINELVRVRLFSIDEFGTIYCEHMVQQKEISDARSAAGKKGGNPKLRKTTSTLKPVESKPESEKSGEYYMTKKNRKLEGNQLIGFNNFWNTFNDKQRGGKAEAADAWLDLKVDKILYEKIIKGAQKEALRRPGLEERNQTPKMAQGWLSARRWET